MKIEILGPGCPRCKALEENVKKALKNKGKQAEVEHTKDVSKITEYGVVMTPALVVDGEVKSSGKVLSPAEIEKYI